ncbi:hypothetical protein GCM10018987_16380 [Streptomyces cremeus]
MRPRNTGEVRPHLPLEGTDNDTKAYGLGAYVKTKPAVQKAPAEKTAKAVKKTPAPRKPLARSVRPSPGPR